MYIDFPNKIIYTFYNRYKLFGVTLLEVVQMTLKRASIAILAVLLLLAVLFFALWLWSSHTQKQGASLVMVNGTLYTQSRSSEPKSVPDGFELYGEVQRSVGSREEVTGELDAYICRKGSEVYLSTENTDLVYVFDGDKCIPHSSPRVQQELINVGGAVYARDSSAQRQTADSLPDGAEQVGRVTGSDYTPDTVPRGELEMNVRYGGYDVYLSADRETVWLVQEEDDEYSLCKFTKTGY